jgi:hypothetical protein
MFQDVVYLTKWLTPWRRRVLSEKLIVTKFSAFHGTPKFRLPCSQQLSAGSYPETCIQSTPFHPISLRSIVISSHLRPGLPSGLFPPGLPTKTLHAFLVYPKRDFKEIWRKNNVWLYRNMYTVVCDVKISAMDKHEDHCEMQHHGESKLDCKINPFKSRFSKLWRHVVLR